MNCMRKLENVKLPLILEEMTVKDVREILKSVKTAILPIGCTEQHGYHLPLCTDSLIAECVSLEAAKRAPVVLLPPLKYSYSGGFLEGTVQIQPSTVHTVVKEILECLLAQGFKGVIIESGHGGGHHMAAIRQAAEEVTRQNPDCYIAVGGGYSDTAREVLKDLVGTTHATTVETSEVLYLRPDLVRQDQMVWEDRPSMRLPLEGPDRFIVGKQLEVEDDFNAKVKIGVGADPSKGSAELGKKIFHECVENMVKLIERMNELVDESG